MYKPCTSKINLGHVFDDFFVDAMPLLFLSPLWDILCTIISVNFSSLWSLGDKSPTSPHLGEYSLSNEFVDRIDDGFPSVHDADRGDINGDWKSGWGLISKLLGNLVDHTIIQGI